MRSSRSAATAGWKSATACSFELSIPTVLREKGYRIGFYSAKPNEPPHVHVKKGGNEAKLWLSPVQLAWSHGLSQHELWDIVRIVEAHQRVLLEAWNHAD